MLSVCERVETYILGGGGGGGGYMKPSLRSDLEKKLKHFWLYNNILVLKAYNVKEEREENYRNHYINREKV